MGIATARDGRGGDGDAGGSPGPVPVGRLSVAGHVTAGESVVAPGERRRA